jgi:chromosomal replication initiation ATPase DnaA
MTQLAFFLDAPRETAGEFFVSDANRQAHDWVNAWPQWPAAALVLCGPEASGKTQLARLWAKKTGASFLPHDTPAAQCLVAGLRAVIEDADQIEEEKLFHLLNHTALMGGSLLLTTRTLPREWHMRLADLRSRLLALPLAMIGDPDDTLLEALLIKHFSDRQLRISPEVMAYLGSRIERSYAAVRDVVARIDAASMEAKRDISVPFIRDILGG